MISVIGIIFFYLGYGLSKSTLFRAPHSTHTHTLFKKKRKKGVLTSSQKEKNRSSIAIAFFNGGTYFFLHVDVAKC